MQHICVEDAKANDYLRTYPAQRDNVAHTLSYVDPINHAERVRATTLLIIVWFVHFALGCRWFTSKPVRAAFLPLSLAVIWFGTIALGAALLDWSA